MINESYVEVMVKRNASIGMKFLGILTMTMAIGTGLVGLMGNILFLAVAAVFGVASYFLRLNSALEFEYTYIDKELQVDKIMAQTKRKRVEALDLNKMEILAPMNSHRLDSYRNRTYKTVDYSRKVEEKPETRYILYMSGEKKVIFEPTMEMLKVIQTIAPRKVFFD
ncbi:MAG: hypothetical protein R3Y24_08210 [Eubacteriales bacterium]